MADTETEQAVSKTTQRMAEAFALLAHEIRSEIVRIFWVDDKSVIPFGDIRSRMTMDVDPSQLHYHLDQLVGHYIERTEDGYRLRPDGIRLLLTVRGQPLERKHEPMLIKPNLNCHTCQKPAGALLSKNGVKILCHECDTVFGYDFLTMPIESFSDGPETFSFSHYSKYIIQKSNSIASGVCPNCANPLEAGFRPRKELSDDQKAVIDHTCGLCKANWAAGIGQVLLADPELRSFCADHGIDLLSTPYWELEFAATDEYVTVHSTDPWEVSLEVTFDDETLELVVDEDLNVIERNRTDTTQDWIPSLVRGLRAPMLVGNNGEGENELRLPDETDCLQHLRECRWPNRVECPHCDGENTARKGTTSKNAQRYRCHDCDRIFNDLTGTIFADHQLSLPEMFHIIRTMEDEDATQIALQLDRNYKSVLNFVHTVRDELG